MRIAAAGKFSTRRHLLKRALRWAALAVSGAEVSIACSPPRDPAPAIQRSPTEPPQPTVAPTTTPSPAPALPTAAPTPQATGVPTAVPAAQRAAWVGELRLATNHAAIEVPWFKKVLDGFVQRQPRTKVDHVNVGSRYLEQVPAWAAEGHLPHVLFVRAQYGAAWAYRKWLVTVDDLVARDAREVDPDDFYPPQVEELKYRGKWLALPYDYSVHGMYCNVDHFTEAGLGRPEDDWSWPDLLAVAKQLTKREGGQVVRWGFNWQPNSWAMPGVWYAEGGSFLNEDQWGIAVNTPENVRVTQWLADLSEVEGVAPRAADLPPGVSLFGPGKVSIEGNGSWAAALYRSLVGAKARLDAAYMPRGAAGRRATHSTGGAWAISRDARNRGLAWELLKHVASKDSIELLVSLPVRNLPGRISATALWLDSLRAIGVPGHTEVFPRMALDSYPLKPVPWWLDYQDAYGELMPLIWNGQKKATEVLPLLERRVNELAARFREADT